MASRLLELSNGNLVALGIINAVQNYPDKGVGIKNEYSKLIDFIKEPDAARRKIITNVLNRLINRDGRTWVQPDWPKEFAKLEVEPSSKKSN